jgi:tetratricopeptide (TPR) repeat protein
MAKTTPNKKPVNKSPQSSIRPMATAAVSKSVSGSKFSSFLYNPYFPYLIIFLFSTGIYFNTIWNQYTIDDALVLTENKFTQQGFNGIKDLMTHDAFVGFFGEKGNELVSGGRYRPLSMVTLAIEVGLFGMNPKISHGINILLFSLTCLLLYYLLSYLIPGNKGTPAYMSVPFIATMLFAGHPIHTEVVANVKGRDEIMGLLFSLLALFAALRYIKTQNILHLIWGGLVFFLALLSKENAITFIAIIPLTYYFFTKAKLKDYLLTQGLYLIPIVGFLIMRMVYTKAGLGAESPEILNNPFAYLPKGMDGYLQRYATIIMTFILYFKLLIFPHPLTHDYYFNQIPFVGISNPIFLLSLLINAGLVLYAIMKFREKEITSYAILFYFITFSIVSNLAFTVGILMNERFVYMCSIGFCLLMAYLLVKAKDRYKLPVQAVMGILIVVLLLYSVKTISRNRVWVDNLTLFIVDAKTSTNSARINMAAGGDLTKLTNENFDTLRPNGRLQYVTDLLDMNVDVTSIPDTTLKTEFLRRAVDYLTRTVSIYPTHASAWLLLGNASYKLHKDPKEALADYEKAATYETGGSYDIWYNIGCVQLENNMPASAKDNFLKALTFKSDKIDARLNLAVSYMKLNRTDSALYWFNKSLEINPHDALTYYKMGTLYGQQLNNLDMAVKCISKAIEYNPNDKTYYEDLGVVYGLKNQPDDAIRVSEECLKRFPNYLPALRNIAISYYKKGDMQKAHEYDARLAQLTGQSNGGIFK